MRRAIVSMVFLAAAAAAYANEQGGKSDAKRLEYFAKMKDVKLQGMRERISLMQESASCVQSAQSPDAMRTCEERERSGMEQHSRRMKDRWESLKPR
jgi:hypothetical protein